MEYTINGIRTKEQARILKILSVESRIKIIYLLKKNTLCVNALACNLGISQGAVSQHLRIMRDAGLVIDEKRGFHVHYRLNDTIFGEWKKLVDWVFDPDNGFEPGSLRKESYCRDY